MINQLAARSLQRLGAVFRARNYLGQSGLSIAFKSFVRPICEYSNVVFASSVRRKLPPTPVLTATRQSSFVSVLKHSPHTSEGMPSL